MMRIAVCDDDAVTRAYLIALIEKQNIDCEIAEFDSAQGYLADGRGFDIIFLDIEMSEGKGTGVELARKIRANMRNQPIIIFVTGYDKYVYDAFDVEAFQYLLKPVEEQKFAQVLQRAVKKIIAEKNAGETLMIRYANSKKAIPTGSIYYIESRNHKVILHLNDGELEYYAKIGELERQLQRSFFRIHKGYLINMFYIDSYTKTDVLLTSGDRLLISKYKYSDFVKAYLRFLKRGLADE
ncbi:MAG: response regulator transcription factor [Firmicutes bacterium]|nr:response regulator transcription factor [Bacillota bacterium]